MKLDDLLSKSNLRYEDLTQEERKTYEKWLKALESKPISVDDIKANIRFMRESVELALVDEEEFRHVLWFKVANRKHVGLKARLKNYILLESFMESKDKAKKTLEARIEGMLT